MTIWYSINLGDALLAGEPLAHLEELFLTEYALAGKPLGMALFTRHESTGDLHCELIAYLSPAALVVAHAVGAARCVRPSPVGLSLLAGEEACWRMLFPGRGL